MNAFNKFFKKIVVGTVFSATFLLPTVLKAQELSLGLEFGGSTGLGSRDLRSIIVSGIQIFLGLLGLILLAIVIYAGYLLMTANGDSEKIKNGKKIIITALIGLAIIFSAYAIVSFVFKNLINSTGGTGGDPGGSGGGGDPIGTVSNFQPSNISPYGRLAIRNVVINVRFNKKVKPESVSENSIFVKKMNADGEYVDVPIKLTLAEENKIVVKATMLCPENPDINCFDFNAKDDNQNKHIVELAYQTTGAVIDINGKELVCLPNSKCQGEFIVGSEIDTKGPKVAIKQLTNTLAPLEAKPTNPNASVSVNGSFIVEAGAEDSSGIAEVKFYNEKDNAFNLIGIYSSSDSSTYVYAKSGPPGLWSTTGLAIDSKHKLIAVATDLAGNVSTSSPSTITIKPAHCFNNELDDENDPDVGPAPDQKETGVDCGGICGACAGQSCNIDPEAKQCSPDNNLCSSSICGETSCLCAEAPVITEIIPDNGASGNWITILGRNFGNLKGEVMINDQVMQLVDFPGCLVDDSWNNNYVLAVVPNIDQGLKNISLQTKTGSTSNSKEFTVNQIKRPGICSLDKTEYEFEDTFKIIGHQFGSSEDDRKVVLGDYNNGVIAENPNFQTTFVEALVPNVSAGKTAVRVEINNQKSNGLPMNIKESAQNKLKIISISPKTGAKGQYVTIIGTGFGNLKNNSQVYFATGKSADFDFPQQCSTNYWSNNVIIAKVPEVTGTPEELVGAIRITVGEQTAESVDKFTINNELPVSPGLCSLYPVKGSVGEEIDVAGDNLNGTVLRFKKASAGVNLTNNNGGKVVIPPNSETGEVTAVNIQNPSLLSNPIPFEIQSIAPTGNTSANYYQWQFKTCAECYRPKVLVIRQCSVNETASPSPLDQSEENFVDASLQVTFDRLMDQNSLNADNALKIEKCTNNPNENGVCTEDTSINLSATVLGNGTNEPSQVVINKSSNLSSFSWYRVTIEQARSVEGISISEPFTWSFKTRINSGVCTPDTLSCTPAQANIAFMSSLNVYARSFDSQTCNICSDVGPWDWKTVNDSVSLEASAISNTKVTGLQEDDNTGAKVKNLRTPNLAEALCKVKVKALAPKIVIDNKCDLTIQSPTPFLDSDNICPNALIGVRFTERMNANSLTQPDAFMIKNENGGVVTAQFHSFIYDQNNWEIGVLIKPLQPLEAEKRYNVFVNPSVVRSSAFLLLDPTSINNWWFRVGDNSNCQIKNILVNPAQRIMEVGQSTSYKALVTGANCQTILPSQTGWQWRTSDTGVASITNSTGPSSTLQSLNPGVTFARARFGGRENMGDNGRVIVGENGGSFRITKVEPLGENICTNALVRITFSKPLKAETVGTRTITMSTGLAPENIVLSANKLAVIIDKPLLSSTSYNVAVIGNDAGVMAFDGAKLKEAGCTLSGLTWNEKAGCQWSFKTGTELCAVNNIQIDPMSATLLVNEAQTWESLAYSQSGQLLSDKSDWSIIDPTLLTFTNGTPSLPSRFASTTAVAPGLTQVQATIGTVSKQASVEIKPELIGPRLISFSPVSPPNSCRNILISATFDDKIDTETIKNNIKVYYQSNQCDNSGGPGGGGPGGAGVGKLLPNNKYVRFFYDWLSLASKYIGGDIVKSMADFIVMKAFADDQWCEVEGSWVSAVIRGSQELNFKQTSLLPANAIIKVVFNGSDNGLLGQAGLPVTYSTGNSQIRNYGDGLFGWQFQTNDNICKVAYVDVYSDYASKKKDWIFNRSDNDTSDDLPNCSAEVCDTKVDGDKVFKAIAKTNDGQQVVSIDNVYSWIWSWRTTNPLAVGLDRAEQPVNNVLTDQQIAIAENNNGESLISATATFAPNANQQAVTGSVKATVFLCANPWPQISEEWVPYTDNKFNFNLLYCRDAGIAGTQDDLPELKYPGQNFKVLRPRAMIAGNYLPVCVSAKEDFCKSNGFEIAQDVQVNNTVSACASYSSSVWSSGNDRTIDSIKCVASDNYIDYTEQAVGDNDLLRQYLLGVPGTTGDAIAIRIYENNYLNNARDWYESNTKNKGTPNIITNGISGYSAINEGRSTYITFADQAGPANQPNQASGRTLVMSYNQDASSNTVSIVEQLLKNIKFNTNVINYEQEQKLKRDFTRVNDLQSMARTLSTAPALTGGTYVPGMSLSVWPSWQETLSPALTSVLPKDPLNKLGSCGDCVNVNDYSIDFEKTNDGTVFQGVNSITQKACSPTDPVLQGKCSLRSYGRSVNGYESGIARTFNLSPNTTYQVSANVYMGSSTPEVMAKLHNDSNSIMKTKTIEPSNKGEWKNVVFEVTTNSFENFKLSFTMLSPNFAEFYIDDVRFKTLSGRCFDFDLTTCWNPKANNNAGEFSCSSNSYAYLYKYNKNESKPELRGKFYALTELVSSWIDDKGVNTNLNSKISLIPPTGNLPVCTSTNVSYSCGDGSVISPEICEPGDSINYCDAGKRWYNPAVSLCQVSGSNSCMGWSLPTATSTCSGKTMAQCCGGYCGDGILNKKPAYRISNDEQCDASVVSGDKGYGSGTSATNQYLCSQSCHDVGGYCGDSVTQNQFGEQCDGSTGLSEWSCSNNAIPTCNGCKITCNGGTPYRGLCGNNIIENGEQCDICGNGLQSVPGQGECDGSSVTAQYSCKPAGQTGQCNWTGGYCGDGSLNVVNGKPMEYCEQINSGTVIPSTNGVKACVDKCQKLSCNDNFYDCDAIANNGCEINGHQGRWLNKISRLPVVAPTPWTYQTSDPDSKELVNCGGCAGSGGSICTWVANSIPICSTGKCKLTCINGYIDENKIYEDGCEKLGVNMSGKVLKQDQTAIGGANVFLISTQNNNRFIFGTAVTNQNGEYSFVGLEKSNYKIVITKKDFYTSTFQFSVTNTNNITKDFTLLPGDLQISGEVKELNSNTVLPGKKVTLYFKPDADLDNKVLESVNSGADGRFLFTGLEKNGRYKILVESSEPYYSEEYDFGAIAKSEDKSIGLNKCGDGVVKVGYEVCDGSGLLNYSCGDIFPNSAIMSPSFSKFNDRDWDGNLTCNASCKSFDFAGLEPVSQNNDPKYAMTYINGTTSFYKFNYNLLDGGDCSYGPPRDNNFYRLIKTNDIAKENQTVYIKDLENEDCWFRARDKCDGDYGVGGPNSIYYSSVLFIPEEANKWHKGKIRFEGTNLTNSSVYCLGDYAEGGICDSKANNCSWVSGGKIYSSRLCWIKK